MASGPQRSLGPPAARGNPARAMPLLQTSNTDSNRNHARYSFMETPVEMQRSTFQQYHQLSSPTNSTIDESPITPASSSRGLPAYPRSPLGAVALPIDIEKAQAQSPQEMHPAFFAPYGDEPPLQQAQQAQQVPALAQPESPRPIPIKLQENPPQFAAPPTNTSTPIPSKGSPEPKVGIDHREAYNPDSLSGPNVGSHNHHPGQISHPNSAIDPHWKKGLCEADALCCMGLICPCMVYGKTMYRLSRRAQKQDPTDMLGYESCNGSCGLMALACGFQGLLAAIQRTRIRNLYHLEGDFGTDCVSACCCCCCVIMQDEREVQNREELIRSNASPVTGAYVVAGVMSYAPPPR